MSCANRNRSIQARSMTEKSLRSSIRFRLMLVYVGSICFTLILFAVVVYLSVIHNLEKEVDDDLATRAQQARDFFASHGFSNQELQAFAQTYGGGTPILKNEPDSKQSSIPADNALNRSDLSAALTYLQLVDKEGRLLEQLPNNLTIMNQPSTQKLLHDRLKLGQNYDYILLADNERARVYTVPLDRIDNKGYLQVVRSFQENDAIIRGLTWPIVLASAAAFFLLGLFGWWITRRTFSPIEDITETAYRIGVNNDLAERIATDPGSNDEVSRLGRAFNAMLERLEKSFKAQKQFIADSSHELRTPLTVIRGNVDLLKRNPDPQNQAESLQAIERESARMQRLVQDLLLLAQADARQTVDLVPLQLDDVVLEVFKETRVLADQRGQHLKLGNFEPVTVEGDRDRLKRAILNLVDNAIKYTQEQGEISISLIAGKQWARVVVADNGLGIEAREQPLVFDRFYRIDKARQRTQGIAGGGTGLGLAIVKHIVEAHGGRISLESETGQGTTFTIWLKNSSTAALPPDDSSEGVEEPVQTAEPKS